MVAILIGILAGIYPSIFLATFRPVQILSGKLKQGAKSGILRSILVIIQFFISVLIILCTIIIYRQINYMLNKDLGFKKEQIETGWLVNKLGNTYSGSSPLGLTACLDVAKPGDKILIVSYGSGAGSDAFIFEVQDRIKEVQGLAPKTRDILDKNKHYLEYGEYAKFRHKIKKAD